MLRAPGSICWPSAWDEYIGDFISNTNIVLEFAALNSFLLNLSQFICFLLFYSIQQNANKVCSLELYWCTMHTMVPLYISAFKPPKISWEHIPTIFILRFNYRQLLELERSTDVVLIFTKQAKEQPGSLIKNTKITAFTGTWWERIEKRMSWTWGQ